jgi:hypothetical protein
MRWFATFPKEQGWYWTREKSTATPGFENAVVVHVVQGRAPDGTRFLTFDHATLPFHGPRQYAGPIPLPEPESFADVEAHRAQVPTPSAREESR